MKIKMIINSDNNSLLIMQDDKLMIRNLNEYNLMKYQDFNGNRIILKIGSVEIVETFNEGIFNVSTESFSMQIRDPKELCKRIKFQDEKYILELMKNEKQDEFNMKFLLESLTQYYDHLKFNQDEIIINGLFSVDKNGQAYFIHNEKKNSLCIVANNLSKLNYNTELGRIDINFRTLEIIHKILFLLNPILTDRVFMNQLPKEIKKLLK